MFARIVVCHRIELLHVTLFELEFQYWVKVSKALVEILPCGIYTLKKKVIKYKDMWLFKAGFDTKSGILLLRASLF